MTIWNTIVNLQMQARCTGHEPTTVHMNQRECDQLLTESRLWFSCSQFTNEPGLKILGMTVVVEDNPDGAIYLS